jgi:hypothetical protein
MWRKFVQKKRNYGSTLQDNHGYGNVFSLQRRKTSTFSRELPEKSTRVHPDFTYGNESSLCGKKIVQNERKYRNTFSEIIMDMGKYFPCKWRKN